MVWSLPRLRSDFEAASARHPDVVFGKIDTDAQLALAAAFEIRAIPTVAVLRDGVRLAIFPGVLSGDALDELVGKVRAIDMDEVRRRIDEKAGEKASDKTASPDDAPAGGA